MTQLRKFVVSFYILLTPVAHIQAHSCDQFNGYNVHKVLIQDSEIIGDITFEGMSGLVEKNLEVSETLQDNNSVNIYCVNAYFVTVINSTIHGNIVIDGISRACEEKQKLSENVF
jgi:hypothetical protein